MERMEEERLVKRIVGSDMRVVRLRRWPQTNVMDGPCEEHLTNEEYLVEQKVNGKQL